MFFSLIFGLIVVGVAMYLINAFIPMDGKVKHLLNIVVIILLVLWVLSALFPSFGGLQLPCR